MTERTIEKIVIHYSDGTVKTISESDYRKVVPVDTPVTPDSPQIWDIRDYWS